MNQSTKPAAELSPGELRLIALSVLGRTLRTLLLSDDTGAAMVRREPPPFYDYGQKKKTPRRSERR